MFRINHCVRGQKIHTHTVKCKPTLGHDAMLVLFNTPPAPACWARKNKFETPRACECVLLCYVVQSGVSLPDASEVNGLATPA